MQRIRKYCAEHFDLNVFLDEYLSELFKLLRSKKKTDNDEDLYLKKELKGLYKLLAKEGYDVSGKEKLIRELTVDHMKKEIDKIEFKTYPLKMISFKQEIANQYRLVDIMHRYFDGFEALKEGDYGCHIAYGRPERTVRVEKVLAEYFHSEAAALVRGGGTGAIRALCFAAVKPKARVLVHDASMYATTKTTFDAMGVEIIKTDFNDFKNIEKEIKNGIDVLYIQRVRQRLADHYDTIEIVEKVRKIDKDIIILADENYAVNKVEKLCCEAGADASTFSTFKLLGIPGIGLITGKKELIQKIHEQNYSGGGQVQGPEATEVLRSLVNNPVLLAVQNLSVDEITDRLNKKEVGHVEKAVKANLEERIILVKLDLPIAREVISEAIKMGALPHPVGSESRYEVQALFYRVAKVILEEEPLFAKYVIRINPMRSGPDTVIRILAASIKKVLKSNNK